MKLGQRGTSDMDGETERRLTGGDNVARDTHRDRVDELAGDELPVCGGRWCQRLASLGEE